MGDEKLQLEVGREYKLVNSSGRLTATYMGLIDDEKHSFFFLRPDTVKIMEIVADDEALMLEDEVVKPKEGYQFGYRGVTTEHPFNSDKKLCKIIDGIIDKSGLDI